MGRAAILLVLLAAATEPLVAWGRDGHIVIARIAAEHLTPSAGAQVIELLANDPEARGADSAAAAMSAVANWADEIKDQTGTSEWHFLDLAASQTKADITLVCGGNDCITARLAELMAVLAASQPFQFDGRSFTPSEQLKFIIHFMGDLHQPLHCATNADAGGNCVRTTGFWSSELHAAWDTELVERLERGSLGAAGLAASLDQEFAERFAEFTKLTDVEQIALESHGIAFSGVYPPLEPGGLSIQPPWHEVSTSCGKAATYEQPAPEVLSWGTFDLAAFYPEPFEGRSAQEQIIAQQLATAGYRLAALLNRIFP